VDGHRSVFANPPITSAKVPGGKYVQIYVNHLGRSWPSTVPQCPDWRRCVCSNTKRPNTHRSGLLHTVLLNTTNLAVGCSEKRYSFYDAICVTIQLAAHISYSPATVTRAEASEGRMGEHLVYRDVRNDGRSNGFTILQAQH
jgi:hypothetical protein